MTRIFEVVEQVNRLLSQGNAIEAEQLIRHVLERHADEGQLWRLMGIARHSRGDFGSAASAIEHAGMLIPLSASDQCLLADCYLHTNNERHARNIYQHLIDDPNCPNNMISIIAAGFGRLKDFRAALKACHLASQREPSSPEPLFGMVFYLCRLGYPPKVSIPLMTRVVSLSPDSSFYRSTLAFLLAEGGRTEEAYDLLREIPPAEASCCCQLRRMMTVFQTVGDFSRWSRCREQLEARQS